MRLLKIFLSLIVAASVSGPIGAWAADTRLVQVTQVDNSRYPDVTIYVSVTEVGGQIVSGLTQADFHVTEDGAAVQITDFKGGEQVALATVLVIDRSGSMNEENKLSGAQQAATTFVDLMRTQDQAALLSFANDVTVDQAFTSDKATLHRAINNLNANGGTAWYDGVYQSVSQFKSVSGRRAVILLSDGLDNQSGHSLDAAIQSIRSAGIPVYAIGLGNQPSGSDPISQFLGQGSGYDEGSLKRVAQETDGQFYYTPSAAELKALYESLAVSFQKDYAITYRSPRPNFDGTRRNIVVTVGASSGGTQYLEQHLLNIKSDIGIGLLLMLPLLAAVIVPLAMRKRKPLTWAEPVPTPPLTVYTPPLVPPQPAWPPAPPSTRSMQPPSTYIAAPPAVSAAVTCVKCGNVLRPDAKFCAKCGTPYRPATTVAQPPIAPQPSAIQPVTQCPKCGNALRVNARFCNRCGQRMG